MVKMRALPGSVLLAGLLLPGGRSGASAPRPGVDWPQFRGIRASGIDDRHPAPSAWDVAKNQPVRWKTPIPGLGHSSPVVWGDTVYLATSISGEKDTGLKVGLYGDIDRSRTRPRTSGGSTRSTRRPAPSAGSAPCSPRAQDQAAHQGHPREFHARHRRRADHRLLRLRRPLRLRHEGQHLWKKDLGVLDAGYYVVPDAQWETGQLADPARRRRRGAGRRAEGLVPRRVRREGRQGAVAQDPRGRADLEHADRPPGQRADPAAGQRHAPRRRLRLQDRRRDLEAVRRRRHPGPDAGRRATAWCT